MKPISTIQVCGGCLQFIANGPGELTPKAAAACAAGVEREGGHVVPGGPDDDGEGGFSRHPCQLCGEYGAGDRYAATVLGESPVYGLLVAWRPYRCRNCGEVQSVSTNHTGPLGIRCPSCSWKPSWGPHVLRVSEEPGSAPVGERKHAYAGKPVTPAEFNPHAPCHATPEPATRFVAVLIDPAGAESFDAYGPATVDREKATQFISAEVAGRAAMRRFGRTGEGFWSSERTAESNARRDYAGWTHRVEESGK